MTICDGCDGILYSVTVVKISTQSTQPSQGKEESEIMTGRLGYNRENGRYGLLVSDLWEVAGFHCGEHMEVMVDGKWVRTRMEMSMEREWYLVDTPYYGDDLEYVKVRI